LQMFAGESIDRVDPDSHGQHLGRLRSLRASTSTGRVAEANSSSTRESSPGGSG
jgi:hypothetical protein